MTAHRVPRARPALAAAWAAMRRGPLALWGLAALAMLADGSCLPARAGSAAVIAAGVGTDRADRGADAAPEPPGSAPFRPDRLPDRVVLDDSPPARQDGPELLGVLCFAFTWLGWVLVVGSLVLPGYLRALASLVRQDGGAWRAFRSGLPRFRAMLGWVLLSSAVQLAASCVGALPGLLLVWIGPDGSGAETAGALLVLAGATGAGVWVALGLMFGPWAVALEGRTPADALGRAWQLARGRRLTFLKLLVAAMGVAVAGLAGLVVFGVGVVATAPLGRALADMMLTEAFLRLRTNDAVR